MLLFRTVVHQETCIHSMQLNIKKNWCETCRPYPCSWMSQYCIRNNLTIIEPSGRVATDSCNRWCHRHQNCRLCSCPHSHESVIFFVCLAFIVLRYVHFVEYVTKPGNGQCDVNIPSLSPRSSRSKTVANDYRHEYYHGCGLWTLVIIILTSLARLELKSEPNQNHSSFSRAGDGREWTAEWRAAEDL